MEKTDREYHSYFNAFKISLGLCLIAFLFNLLAFVTPYWLVAIPEYNSQFVRLGLWVACFNDYIHPEDYVSKKYTGCWYVYYPEFNYIRDWLNPTWFFCVQWLSTLAFVCNLLVLIIIALKACKEDFRSQRKTNAIMVVAQFIAFGSFIVVIVLMGVMSKDREWMPRFDQNQLSWSFGFAVIAGFATAFSTITMTCHYMICHWPHGPFRPSDTDIPEAAAYQAVPIENQSVSTGGLLGTTSAAMASAKHRDALQSQASYQSHLPRSAPRSTGGHSTLQTYADSTV